MVSTFADKLILREKGTRKILNIFMLYFSSKLFNSTPHFLCCIDCTGADLHFIIPPHNSIRLFKLGEVAGEETRSSPR
jgi:hypothetical protein